MFANLFFSVFFITSDNRLLPDYHREPSEGVLPGPGGPGVQPPPPVPHSLRPRPPTLKQKLCVRPWRKQQGRVHACLHPKQSGQKPRTHQRSNTGWSTRLPRHRCNHPLRRSRHPGSRTIHALDNNPLHPYVRPSAIRGKRGRFNKRPVINKHTCTVHTA